jgi:2-polyprenyl-3-methyl-5-hydroxy-6-metoxy-1,4-benzoquinol methylase
VNIPFILPPPVGSASAPSWNGTAFQLGEVLTPVLEYSENFAGWSDDLTALHEDAAGSNHPIDLASRRHALEQVLESRPSRGAVIMEIGCSSGFLVRRLVESFPDANVIGADVVKEPLHRLAQQAPGIPLIRFDLLQCPLPPASVDVLVMLNVLEHIEDDRLALRRALELLKPGGSLILEVPAGPALYDGYDRELRHFRRYSRKELLGKLAEAGFRVGTSSHLGFLLFPAFATVKRLNQLRHLPRAGKSVVATQAGSTQSSKLIRALMEFELGVLGRFSLPFGIRVLATARRPV